MKMEDKNKLLVKYYSGETNLEEESQLKNDISDDKNAAPEEKVIFSFYRKESSIPEGLENRIFRNIEKNSGTSKIIKMRWFRVASVAATVLILLAAYLGYREVRKAKIENQFFVMEQALYQVSQSIQPEEQEEMLVLWLDDDVEIIIN